MSSPATCVLSQESMFISCQHVSKNDMHHISSIHVIMQICHVLCVSDVYHIHIISL